MGRGLTLALFSLLFLVTLAGVLAPFVPLELLPAVQVVTPLMLGLGLLHVIFLFVFIRQKKFAGIILTLLALSGVGWAVSKDFRPFTQEAPSETGLKVISYNVGGFGFEAERVYQTAEALSPLQADVIALQEFRNHQMPDGSLALDYLKRALDMPYVRFEHLPQHIHGGIIFSRYPITAVDTMFMPEREINTGIIATLESPLGRIGVGNLHLSSYRISGTLEEHKGENRLSILNDIYKNSLEVLPLQQEKVDQILETTLHYPYPLVLTGDFNAVAHSRIMQPFFTRYTDSFLASGRGIGRTLPLLGPIGLRIDYQFVSDALIPIRHEVLDIRQSDHRPIAVSYSLMP